MDQVDGAHHQPRRQAWPARSPAGRTGVTEQRLQRAALPLARNQQRGQKGADHRQHHHQQPRHQKPRALARLVEPGTRHHRRTAHRSSRRLARVQQGGPVGLLLRMQRQRTAYVTLDGGCLGGFRAVDQQLHRRRTGLQLPREIGRHLHDGLDLVATHQRLGLVQAVDPLRLHVARAADALHHGLCLRRGIFHHQGHPHVLHVEGHAVAKQQDHRDGQGQPHQQIAAVAQHLVRFLHHQRTQAPEKTAHVHLPSPAGPCSTPLPSRLPRSGGSTAPFTLFRRPVGSRGQPAPYPRAPARRWR